MAKTKRATELYKKFVRETARQAAWNIGVSNYQIDIHYMEKDKPLCACGEDIVAGEMTVDRRYLRGVLRLYPYVLKKWNSGDKERVREVVHHEVAHLATQHMMTIATASYKDEGETKDAWESLTETVARLSLNLDKYKREKK